MSFDPRSWGPVALSALALLLVGRLPSVLATPDPVAMAGGLTGTLLGGVVVVGLGRKLVLAARTTDAPAE